MPTDCSNRAELCPQRGCHSFGRRAPSNSSEYTILPVCWVLGWTLDFVSDSSPVDVPAHALRGGRAVSWGTLELRKLPNFHDQTMGPWRKSSRPPPVSFLVPVVPSRIGSVGGFTWERDTLGGGVHSALGPDLAGFHLSQPEGVGIFSS